MHSPPSTKAAGSPRWAESSSSGWTGNATAPNAWIQTGRFADTDRRHILDSPEIRSLPATAVEDAIRFVRRHTSREAVIGDARRVDRWTTPLTPERP